MRISLCCPGCPESPGHPCVSASRVFIHRAKARITDLRPHTCAPPQNRLDGLVTSFSEEFGDHSQVVKVSQQVPFTIWAILMTLVFYFVWRFDLLLRRHHVAEAPSSASITNGNHGSVYMLSCEYSYCEMHKYFWMTMHLLSKDFIFVFYFCIILGN